MKRLYNFLSGIICDISRPRFILVRIGYRTRYYEVYIIIIADKKTICSSNEAIFNY